MLSDEEVHALVHARHPDPFAVLGLHADAQGGLWLRALLPQAAAVAVLDAGSGERLAELLKRHDAGFWLGRIPNRHDRSPRRPHRWSRQRTSAYHRPSRDPPDEGERQ